MRALVISLLLHCLAAVSGCATSASARAVDDDAVANESIRAEVLEVCAEMEQAMRDNDLKRVASFYADDAILLNARGEMQGGSRAAIEEYWAGFGQGVDWSLITYSVEGVEGIVTQCGRSILNYVRDGERRTGIVEFVLIWQRQEDGTLKIAVDGYW